MSWLIKIFYTFKISQIVLDLLHNIFLLMKKIAKMNKIIINYHLT